MPPLHLSNRPKSTYKIKSSEKEMKERKKTMTIIENKTPTVKFYQLTKL